ncbi:trypsin II-P29-like isoform X2 [Pseudomyrmex gracilis]|uniref:trypsin II-P29-like isoform X2 n=1 Tax=Pseudomyrmex gracilis TaxID=219809 RepID=UPI000994CC3B|nr:trypsin II-P29-like isoform X2 [Pseudomyrmex gracilis]
MQTKLLLWMCFAFSWFTYGSLTNVSVLPQMEWANYRLTGRIVNGSRAALRQFPHQVSLQRSWSGNHFCGGSIISTNLVLTAAHCMYSRGAVIQPWSIIVVGGVIKLEENVSTKQEKGVDSIRIHPDFDITTLYNDVAILRLSGAFKFTPELRSASLPSNSPVPKTVCQVSGWGYLDSNIPIVSNDLMYVDLPVLSTKQCRELLINVTDLPEGMYCAGYIEGGRDACQGDSGGGMVCNNVLTGIVSGGEGCALPGLPGVYTDVFHYLDWITQTESVVIVQSDTRV